MHRFTRLAQLTCLTSITATRTVQTLPLRASLIQNRPSLCRSFVAWQPLRAKQDTPEFTNATVSATTEETEEDDLEEIDPKLYEELTTDENGETIDTDWFVEEEDFVPLWQRRAIEGHLQERQAALEELVETGAFTVDTVKQLLEESKMDDVQVLDIREKCDWTDYMVIASSERGERFLSNVAESIAQAVSQKKERREGIPACSPRLLWLYRCAKRLVLTPTNASPSRAWKGGMMRPAGCLWTWADVSCICLPPR